MAKENKNSIFFVWLILLTGAVMELLIVVSISSTKIKELSTPISFDNLLDQNNLSRYCIEYNKEKVLRYNITCKSCYIYNHNGDIETTSDCLQSSNIQEDKDCGYFATLVKAQPVEVEVETDCIRWGIGTKIHFEFYEKQE